MRAEIQGLSADAAAAWATTMLAVKNRLTAEDQTAFEAHLASFPTDPIKSHAAQTLAPEQSAGQNDRVPVAPIASAQTWHRSACGLHPADRASPEQGASAVCQNATLPDLRPATCQRPLFAICAAPCLGPEGPR